MIGKGYVVFVKYIITLCCEIAPPPPNIPNHYDSGTHPHDLLILSPPNEQKYLVESHLVCE